MDVVKVTPRGYCYGVVDALVLAKRAANDASLPRPIVVLGQIVHNRHAVAELATYDIQTLDTTSGRARLDLLDQVPAGATVIFTAHGVSPAVRAEAARRGFHVLDATCPDVTKTHRLIQDRTRDGYFILYIGTPGHPEPEGSMGEAIPGRATLVATVAERMRLHQYKRRLPLIAKLSRRTIDQDFRYPRDWGY